MNNSKPLLLIFLFLYQFGFTQQYAGIYEDSYTKYNRIVTKQKNSIRDLENRNRSLRENIRLESRKRLRDKSRINKLLNDLARNNDLLLAQEMDIRQKQYELSKVKERNSKLKKTKAGLELKLSQLGNYIESQNLKHQAEINALLEEAWRQKVINDSTVKELRSKLAEAREEISRLNELLKEKQIVNRTNYVGLGLGLGPTYSGLGLKVQVRKSISNKFGFGVHTGIGYIQNTIYIPSSQLSGNFGLNLFVNPTDNFDLYADFTYNGRIGRQFNGESKYLNLFSAGMGGLIELSSDERFLINFGLGGIYHKGFLRKIKPTAEIGLIFRFVFKRKFFMETAYR